MGTAKRRRVETRNNYFLYLALPILIYGELICENWTQNHEQGMNFREYFSQKGSGNEQNMQQNIVFLTKQESTSPLSPGTLTCLGHEAVFYT